MKRKIFEKILAIGSVIVAIVFVLVLLITMFGGIDATEFNNQLVQGLFVSLGVVYLLLAAGIIAYQFIDSDAVKEIVINSHKQTSTKASAAVIKKIAKKHIATVEGVKCSRVIISLTEYGVRLKVGIKVVDKEIQEVAALLKCMLEDVYYEILGYRFYAIDFKVLSLKSTYSSDMSSVEEKAKEELVKQKEEDEEAAKLQLEKAQKETEELQEIESQDEVELKDNAAPVEEEKE